MSFIIDLDKCVFIDIIVAMGERGVELVVNEPFDAVSEVLFQFLMCLMSKLQRDVVETSRRYADKAIFVIVYEL